MNTSENYRNELRTHIYRPMFEDAQDMNHFMFRYHLGEDLIERDIARRGNVSWEEIDQFWGKILRSYL